jgi:hypothetical protein
MVKDTWEKMPVIETVYGKGKMGGLNTYGINHVVVKPYAIGRIKNAKIEHVKWAMSDIP